MHGDNCSPINNERKHADCLDWNHAYIAWLKKNYFLVFAGGQMSPPTLRLPTRDKSSGFGWEYIKWNNNRLLSQTRLGFRSRFPNIRFSAHIYNYTQWAVEHVFAKLIQLNTSINISIYIYIYIWDSEWVICLGACLAQFWRGKSVRVAGGKKPKATRKPPIAFPQGRLRRWN